MKTIPLILLSFFFLQNAFGQEKQDTTVKKEGRWSMGMFFSPNYSFYNYESNVKFNSSKPIWQAFPHGQPLYKTDKYYFNNYPQNGETRYRSKINPLSFSVMFRFQATKKFIIYTGLDVLQLGYIGEGLGAYNGVPMQYKEINNDYYIGVPLLFGYRLKKEKFSFELSIGPTLYTPLLSTKKFKWNNGTEEKYEWTPYKFISKKNWSVGWMLYQPFLVLNTKVIKKINNNLSLSLGINFKYSIFGTFTIVRAYVGNGYPVYTTHFYYSTSIPIGIIYHFK